MKQALMIALLLAASACNLSNRQPNSEKATAPSPQPSGSAPASTAPGNDKTETLRELVDIEKRWKEANFKGDTKTLETIFADEFSNVAENGKTYNKSEWIAVWKRGDPTVKSWEISEERLDSLEKERATLTFVTTIKYKNSKVARVRNTDTFIKRDGRWLVIASQSSML
ncbi:MAG TPA: nuclear transport factor 2 family protein [Pyrinomonadaceae bacterium]|jgi:hypothetical protein